MSCYNCENGAIAKVRELTDTEMEEGNGVSKWVLVCQEHKDEIQAKFDAEAA